MNLDLTVRVLAQIEREPQRHDQMYWQEEGACGTVHCFAGWACVLDGWQPVRHASGLTLDSIRRGPRRNPRRGYVPMVAPTLLELRPFSKLFSPENTVDDLYRICADELGCTVDELAGLVADEVDRVCEDAEQRDRALERVKSRGQVPA